MAGIDEVETAIGKLLAPARGAAAAGSARPVPK
jgi:hypothetical protein